MDKGTIISDVRAVIRTLKATAYDSTLLIAELPDGTVIKTFERLAWTLPVGGDGDRPGAQWKHWTPGQSIFIASAKVKKLEEFKGREFVVVSDVKIDPGKSERVCIGGLSMDGTSVRTFSDGVTEVNHYQIQGEPDAAWATRQRHPELATAAVQSGRLFRDPQARDYDLSSRYPVEIADDGSITPAGEARLAELAAREAVE